MEQQGGGTVKRGRTRKLVATGLHIEQGFAETVVVQRLDAEMARDGEHEGDRQVGLGVGVLFAECIDHIVEKVGHGFLLAKGFVEKLRHKEAEGVACHIVGGGGRGAGLATPVGNNLLKVVDLVFGIIIDHKVEVAEGLEQVLLGAATAFAHPFKDIGADTKLAGEDFGYDRRLGIGGGVQHKGGGGEEWYHGYRTINILATERILPLASEAKTI